MAPLIDSYGGVNEPHAHPQGIMSGMTAEALRSGIDFKRQHDYTQGRPSVSIENSLETIRTSNRNSNFGMSDTMNSLQKRATVSKALEMNRVFPINLSYQMHSTSQGANLSARGGGKSDLT